MDTVPGIVRGERRWKFTKLLGWGLLLKANLTLLDERGDKAVEIAAGEMAGNSLTSSVDTWMIKIDVVPFHNRLEES